LALLTETPSCAERLTDFPHYRSLWQGITPPRGSLSATVQFSEQLMAKTKKPEI
jgi:hypothetical protein